MRQLGRIRSVVLYYLSWIVFGAVGVLLNMACIVLMALPGRDRYAPAVRAAIKRLFGAWIAWLHATRIAVIDWKGFDAERLQAGTVYIANHPSIVDATLILARLPDAVCIFKPALMRNPAVGPAAVMAGYVRGDTGLDLMKAAAARVAAGQSLLVFPEGTRTAEGTLIGKMKPGFALIARRAGVPIQVLIVRTERDLLPRDRPWWRMPRVPIRYAVLVDRQIDASAERPIADIVAEVQGRFHAGLACAP